MIERLKYIMKLNSLSSSAFADKIGVQRSSISHVLSGRNKPSLEFIQKVLEAFPKVNAQWLITGEKVVSQEKTEDEIIGLKSKLSLSEKKIAKIMVFYDDNTFEEFKR